MKQKVLELLHMNSGDYVSGSEISRRLGVSRTAVWKQISTLRLDGYDIQSQTNRGYKLMGGPDILLPSQIKLDLETSSFGRRVVYYETTHSTNIKAKELAAEGEVEGTIVVAEEQGRGRGRLGREWSSPKGKGLWFSLILRPPISPMATPQLTLVAAVAVVKAIRKVVGLDVVIKWPNDILYKGKKMVGILTELTAELDRVNYVVLGVGINVNLELDDFPESFREIGTSLQLATGRSWDRVRLLQVVLQELESAYYVYLRDGFSSIREEWCNLAGSLHRQVTITQGKEVFTGIAEDLDSEGRLLVRLPDRRLRPVIAGEIHLD